MSTVSVAYQFVDNEVESRSYRFLAYITTSTEDTWISSMDFGFREIHEMMTSFCLDSEWEAPVVSLSDSLTGFDLSDFYRRTIGGARLNSGDRERLADYGSRFIKHPGEAVWGRLRECVQQVCVEKGATKVKGLYSYRERLYPTTDSHRRRFGYVGYDPSEDIVDLTQLQNQD